MRTRTGTMLRSVLMPVSAMLMVLAVAAIALAADINGKWKGELDVPDGSKITNTFTFKVDGEKVTGSVHSSRSGNEAPIEDGTLKGDALSFTITRNIEGTQAKLRYTGKVKADEIAMTVAGDVGGQSFEMQLVAKREK
jgi:hypothetical protein